MKMTGIGETTDGVEVVSVDKTSATVKFNGEVVTIKVEQETPSR